jgi:putative PIN family toxin of toxin-antitoxin system
MQRSKPIAVIDTNVVLSGIIKPDSHCGKILDLISKNKISIIYTQSILYEINQVLRRPKFEVVDPEKIVGLIIKAGKSIETVEIINDCRDPDDNKFLECALAGNASHIITGDKDLLTLNPWKGINILSPREFLEQEKQHHRQ